MAASETTLKPTGLLQALLLVLPAVAASLSTELAALMVYDRAAILQGEIWRLLTGHWVHFSFAHLASDTLVLAGCTWLITRRGFTRFPAVCLLLAPGISLVLLVGLPELARYGGLSALALTGMTLAGLQELRGDRCRRFGAGLLALVALRLVADMALGGATLSGIDSLGVRPVPLGHLLGLLGGLAVFVGHHHRRPASGAGPSGKFRRVFRSGPCDPDKA